MRKYILFFIIITLFTNTQCKEKTDSTSTSKKANEQTTESKQTTEKKSQLKGTLLFFTNTKGIPCQMQERIILGISKDIEKRFYIRFVETTNADDRDIFYDYTIRMLPTIIILGSKNNIIKRFSPGIQSKDVILNAVQEL